jgi:hypothetical protein
LVVPKLWFDHLERRFDRQRPAACYKRAPPRTATVWLFVCKVCRLTMSDFVAMCSFKINLYRVDEFLLQWVKLRWQMRPLQRRGYCHDFMRTRGQSTVALFSVVISCGGGESKGTTN